MTLKNKIVSADEAIAIIRDGDTICVSGFVGIGTPDELIIALERRFLKERHPSGLTLVFAAAPGDGKERGLNRLAHRGLLKRVVGGHWSLVPGDRGASSRDDLEGGTAHVRRSSRPRRQT
jgi:propionate CoA-transferase